MAKMGEMLIWLLAAHSCSWISAVHSQLRFHYMTPSLLVNSLGSSDSCSSESTLFIYRYIYLLVVVYLFFKLFLFTTAYLFDFL